MKLTPWSQTTPLAHQAAMATAAPGYVIPNAWFRDQVRDFDLWLICDGEVVLTQVDGTTSTLRRGSAVWLSPGRIRELRVNPGSPYTNAYIHFDLLDAAGAVIPPDCIETPPLISTIQDMHYFEATMRRIMYLQYQYAQTGSIGNPQVKTQISLLLKGLLHDYELAQSPDDALAGIQKHQAQVVSSALSWIYLHPKTTLSIKALAEKFGYSQRHFCRIFRQETKRSPRQALIAARIDRAKNLLTSSALNVSEIAESLAYENVFYFSRQFKKVTGLSPIRFRQGRSKI